ncbi:MULTISPECIES: hypothetical protein [Actinoplanes]|uniref:hypothetical protein n=1 Tax=Actinoplanes TaxID=1865 RepID=UPI0005F2DE2F|nr:MULTISPECIES: hypothetical protein [Actinoplanes]GLY01740.1 hypothetical protein Acsp01_21190 [Actinoplanes sp. NBRC 101535]
MDTAVDVAYAVQESLIGPGAIVPWWAWVAPLLMVFGKLLWPVMVPDSTPLPAKKDKKGKKKK